MRRSPPRLPRRSGLPESCAASRPPGGAPWPIPGASWVSCASVPVRLEFLPGEVRVDIDDDGAGATAPATVSAGGGLVGMRERVHAYGGDVRAGPGQTGGWRGSARLHLEGGDLDGGDLEGGDAP